MMLINYYTLLKVASNASTADIKRAYRQLARLHHPDLNEQAQDELMKLLNEAYAVLSDSRKRAAYDRQRRQEQKDARREREQAASEQERAQREPQMSWIEGAFGFVKELRKGLRDD